jgi:hypothetical protein
MKRGHGKDSVQKGPFDLEPLSSKGSNFETGLYHMGNLAKRRPFK